MRHFITKKVTFLVLDFKKMYAMCSRDSNLVNDTPYIKMYLRSPCFQEFKTFLKSFCELQFLIFKKLRWFFYFKVFRFHLDCENHGENSYNFYSPGNVFPIPTVKLTHRKDGFLHQLLCTAITSYHGALVVGGSVNIWIPIKNTV